MRIDCQFHACGYGRSGQKRNEVRNVWKNGTEPLRMTPSRRSSTRGRRLLNRGSIERARARRFDDGGWRGRVFARRVVVVVVGGLSYFEGSAEAFSSAAGRGEAHGACKGRKREGARIARCRLGEAFRFADVVVGGGDSRGCAVWCVSNGFRGGRRSFRKGKVAGSDGAHGSRRGTAEFCVETAMGVLATANGDSNDEQRSLCSVAGELENKGRDDDDDGATKRLTLRLHVRQIWAIPRRQQGFHSRARAPSLPKAPSVHPSRGQRAKAVAFAPWPIYAFVAARMFRLGPSSRTSQFVGWLADWRASGGSCGFLRMFSVFGCGLSARCANMTVSRSRPQAGQLVRACSSKCNALVEGDA